MSTAAKTPWQATASRVQSRRFPARPSRGSVPGNLDDGLPGLVRIHRIRHWSSRSTSRPVKFRPVGRADTARRRIPPSPLAPNRSDPFALPGCVGAASEDRRGLATRRRMRYSRLMAVPASKPLTGGRSRLSLESRLPPRAGRCYAMDSAASLGTNSVSIKIDGPGALRGGPVKRSGRSDGSGSGTFSRMVGEDATNVAGVS